MFFGIVAKGFHVGVSEYVNLYAFDNIRVPRQKGGKRKTPLWVQFS